MRVGRSERENLWKRLLGGWIAVAGRFGAVQTLVVLGLFYGLLIGPLALASRLTGSDFLRKRPLGSGETGWCAADTSPADLERARLTS
jgi:hypothetical protein